TLSAPLWQRLNTSWILFFVILGLINLYVVYNFDTDTWVNFKLFGMFGLTFAFIIIQSLLLGKYMKLPESDNKE
ncbi:MAG: intracellular septation protein, partial [Halothiobacillaceae bacterium]